MKKHNRQSRQLGALIRLYEYFGAYWISLIDKGHDAAVISPSSPIARNCIALRSLERQLSPELVAWARMTYKPDINGLARLRSRFNK